METQSSLVGEFALKIIDLSGDEYDISDTLNGIAVAAGSILFATSFTDDKEIDEEQLKINVEKFLYRLQSSINSSKNQLKNGDLADKLL